MYAQAIYAVGGNAEASRLSGIRVNTTVGSTYVLSGLAMGVAGIITASQLNSAQANINPNIVFDVITIVVVGGTSLAGGIRSMWRTAVGLGIVATISNAFSLADIDPYYQDIVKGCIIIGALALDTYTRRLEVAGVSPSYPPTWRPIGDSDPAMPTRARARSAAGQGGRMSRVSLFAAIAVAAAVLVAIVLSTTGAPATENASSTVDRLGQCRPGDAAPTVVLVHGAWADASSWPARCGCCKTRASAYARSRIRSRTSPPTPDTSRTS